MQAQCNLIIDSCCDLPLSVVDREGVELIRFPYMVGSAQRTDDLYQSITPKQFYDIMRDRKAEKPTTAQLSMAVLTDTFARACESGVPTVYLSFSSGLSGSFDTAQLIAGQMAQDYPDAQLHLVDTKLASIAEGLLVLEAIEQREKGLTADQMVQWAKEARWYVNAQFMVDDLDALQRGGRIPSTVAMAGSKLDVKPLLGFDLAGKLALNGVARGRKKGIRALVDYYKKRACDQATPRRIVIGHADCVHDLERLRDELAKSFTDALFLETAIGPTIGSHVGPGMLALVFWGPDRRDDISVADRIANRVKERG